MFIAYVVSGIVLISALALSLMEATATSYRLARNGIENAEAEAIIEAAVARAVLGLLDTRRDRRWRVDGTPQDLKLDNTHVRIAVQDELGRIDLNHADRSTLARLFQSAGLGMGAADALAGKVLEWRGPGGGRGGSGGKGGMDGAAEVTYVSRNGPFQSVGELKLVEGMTPELYRRLEGALTVYSGRQFIDPQFAPAQALAALPGQSRETAAAVIAARSGQGRRAGTIDPTIALGGRAFTIRMEISRSGGVLAREVVVRLTDDVSEPYWVLSWRQE